MKAVMETLSQLQRRITSCQKCTRLRKHCSQIAKTKKREFREWEYWGKPVPSFGDPKARLWILGLAPAAHGANRTGRMFTGDSSGRWVYKALHRVGLSDREVSTHHTDGLLLKDVYISATAHCAPPDNKPTPREILNCQSFLDEEFRLLKEVKIILATGSIAFKAACQLFERNGIAMPRPKPLFKHGVFYDFGGRGILSSYHPSRQNTQTGRLTESMWNAIFDQAKQLLN